MDIISLLARNEGKTLEFKRDLSSPNGVLKTIIAFANTSGGVVVIGVEDRTKRVRGIPNILAEEERLASLISDCISPTLIPSLEIMPWKKAQVLVAEVYPSPTRPHFLKKLGPEAGVLVRVGSTNRRADRFLIEEMLHYSRVSSFDEQPMPGLNSEALDFRAASEFFSASRKLTKEALETLKLTTRYQGRIVPTRGGVLLFGTTRAEHFPDAWIQAARFTGTDRRKIFDSREIKGHLPDCANQAEQFLKRHMNRTAEIASVRRKDVWTLPLIAIREALMNAIVHADYGQQGAPIRVALFDDRLEIENPGLLPFGLTIEDIRRGVSKLRNRVIGRIFQELGLIEQWGSGIQRMTGACVDAGLALPKLEEIGTHFRVTLAITRTAKPKTNERDDVILAALTKAAVEGLSTAELASRTGLSTRATRSRLASLVEKELAYEVGSGPNDPRRRYFVKTA